MSREHALGDWLSDELPTAARPAAVRQEREFDGVSLGERGLSPVPFGYITKEVCDPCNTTWLSDLETTAAALLKPSIHGDPVRLRHRDQVAVAAWAYKGAAMLSLSLGSDGAAVSRIQAPGFKAVKRPPPATRVWVCRLAEGDRFSGQVISWTSILTEGGVPPTTGVRNAFLVAFGTGCLAWFVFATTSPDVIRGLSTSGDSRQTSAIWPASLDARYAPPRQAQPLTSARVQQIVRNFSASLGRDHLLPTELEQQT